MFRGYTQGSTSWKKEWFRESSSRPMWAEEMREGGRCGKHKREGVSMIEELKLVLKNYNNAPPYHIYLSHPTLSSSLITTLPHITIATPSSHHTPIPSLPPHSPLGHHSTAHCRLQWTLQASLTEEGENSGLESGTRGLLQLYTNTINEAIMKSAPGT